MMRNLSYFFLIVVIIFPSCTQRKSNPQPPAHQTVKKITIKNVGAIEFNKSYSFIQSMTLSEKEIEQMKEETDNENPGNRNPADSSLKNRFEKLGFVKDDELLLEKFKYSSDPEILMMSPAGKEIRIRIKKDTTTGLNNKMIAYFPPDSAEMRITHFMKLKYALLDVIPGGNKELVILDEGYLANNYLYDFFVYEIKTVH